MFKRFMFDRAGTVAVTTALVAIPLLAVAGMVIDVTNSMRIQSDNQNALDAAVLAAVHEASKPEAVKTLKRVFEANGGQGPIVDVDYVNDPSGRSVWATGKLNKHNDFAAILGQPITAIGVAAKATAQPTLLELKLKPIYAKGTYNKIMYLFDTPPPNAPVEIANIRYDIVRRAASGTMKMTPSRSSLLTIKNPSSLYFTMEIDPTSEYIYPTTKLHLATNDPATSHHLFVDGKQLPTNTAVNIANYVPCGKSSLFEWEDGGDFGSQDFGFEVTGNCKVNANSPVALVK